MISVSPAEFSAIFKKISGERLTTLCRKLEKETTKKIVNIPTTHPVLLRFASVQTYFVARNWPRYTSFNPILVWDGFATSFLSFNPLIFVYFVGISAVSLRGRVGEIDGNEEKLSPEIRRQNLDHPGDNLLNSARVLYRALDPPMPPVPDASDLEVPKEAMSYRLPTTPPEKEADVQATRAELDPYFTGINPFAFPGAFDKHAGGLPEVQGPNINPFFEASVFATAQGAYGFADGLGEKPDDAPPNPLKTYLKRSPPLDPALANVFSR